MRKKRRLLVDGGNPERAGERRLHVRHGTAGDAQRSRIGGHGTGDDLDERRFAGAVFPHERVDFAVPEIERHASERTHARK